MKSVSKLALSLYGLALVASLTGASMLLSGFLIAADWNFGVHVAMVAYFLVSSLGTLGLFVATAFFWSSNSVVIRVGLISNIETLVFSSLLAIAILLDKHVDPSPEGMLVGLSRSISFGVSVSTWVAVPVLASLLGTCASLWRRRSANGFAGTAVSDAGDSSAYLSG